MLIFFKLYSILKQIVSAIHGLFIFLVLVVWRERVRKELAGKRILCFTCPHSWADAVNIEEERLQVDSECN